MGTPFDVHGISKISARSSRRNDPRVCGIGQGSCPFVGSKRFQRGAGCYPDPDRATWHVGRGGSTCRCCSQVASRRPCTNGPDLAHGTHLTQRSAAPRLDRLVPAGTITAATGIPWTWGITHRAGGALLIAALLFTLLVHKALRKLVFTLLSVGIASHFVIDYVLWQPTGGTNRMRWPFLDLRSSIRASIAPPIAGPPSCRRSPPESSLGPIGSSLPALRGNQKTFRRPIDRQNKHQYFPPPSA